MKVTGKGLKEFKRDMKRLGNTTIQIGAVGNHSGFDGTNAELLVIHEFGAKIKKRNGEALKKPIIIPARAPIRSTFRSKSNLKMIQRNINGLIANNTEADGGLNVDRIADGIGLTVKNLVQATIKRRVSPPNTENTLRRKRGSVPLIDSGQLVNSIEYGVKT